MTGMLGFASSAHTRARRMNVIQVRRDSKVFQMIKARYCIVAMIIAWYWQPGVQVFSGVMFRLEWYWRGLVFHYYGHGTIALFLIIAALLTQLRPRYFLGRRLAFQDISPILFVVVFTYCISFALFIFTIIPLSYLFPGFVTWWLEARWFEPLVYLTMDGAFVTEADILSFVSLVILAPFLEEFLFRGYLLHRWTKKWGLWTGVLFSSLLFGVIHPDILGATATGIGFAMLYLKTRTLWAPIVAHAIYNLLVWSWDFYGVASKGADYYTAYTIDQLRGELWYGAIALVIVLVMIDQILRRDKPLGPFSLPVLPTTR